MTREDRLEKVQEDVTELKVKVSGLELKLKIGFAITGALIASPKLGLPSASDAIVAVVHYLA